MGLCSGFVFLLNEHIHGEDDKDTNKQEDDGEDLFAAPRSGEDVGIFDDQFFLAESFTNVILVRPDTSEGTDHKASEEGHRKGVVMIKEPL